MLIQLSEDEFHNLKTQIARLEQQLEAEKKRTRPELGDVSPVLLAGYKAGIEIVRYLAGNWDPLTHRGLPVKAVELLVETMKVIPIEDMLKEAIPPLEQYVGFVKEWEQARAEGREQEKLREENLASHGAVIATPKKKRPKPRRRTPRAA